MQQAKFWKAIHEAALMALVQEQVIAGGVEDSLIWEHDAWQHDKESCKIVRSTVDTDGELCRAMKDL